MNKKLSDYSDRCGGCKYFAWRVNGNQPRSNGCCENPNRKNYHDASQQKCKLFKPYICVRDKRRIGKD